VEPSPVERPTTLSVLRWLLLLVLLLLAEGLALGIAFDSDALSALPLGWWTPVLRFSGSAMPLAAALLVAIVLVCWARGERALLEHLARAGERIGRLLYLALHLTSFGALFALSRLLFSGRPPAAGVVGALVAAWLLAVAATLGAWLAAMAPPRSLFASMRAHGGLLVAAIGLGAVAFSVGKMAQGLWLPLRKATFALASALLAMVCDGAVADPATLSIGTDLFTVEIAPQCSGYEGVGLTSVFVLAALWLFRARLRFPRAYWLLLPAAILPWLANAGRLVALVLIGSFISPELAAGGFHSYAGSILFCVVALTIVAAGLRAPWLAHDAPRGTTGAHAGGAAAWALDRHAVAYLLPFMAMTAAGLVSRAFAGPHGEPLYLLRPLAAIAALAALRGRYPTPLGRPSAAAVLAGVVMAALWLLVERILPAARTSSALPEAGPLLQLARLATTITLVPPVEELAFRGFLARRISTAAFDEMPPERISWPGIALSALAFGFLHRRPLAAALAGIGYALVYRRRGRLSDAVVAHAVTNAVLIAVGWATGNRDLWY